MTRSVLAFLVAPLWVPLLVAPFAFLILPSRNQYFWSVFTIVLCALLSYGGTFLLGIPMFRFLRARRLTGIWPAAIAGFLIGPVTYLGFLVVAVQFLPKRDFRMSVVVETLGLVLSSPRDLGFLLGTGLLGAIVGMTLWIIARPDRQSPKTG